MSLLEWQQQFSLGVAAMDRDHQQLVAAMNKIHELDAADAGPEAVDAAIRMLMDLTSAHFAAEERHMEKIAYPALSRHRRIHQDMLRCVGEHHEAFQRGDGKVSKAFFDFLVHWLAAHICHIDRKYALHPVPAAT